MKSYVLLLVLLQVLGSSGVPVYNSELAAMADRGLVAALAEVQSAYAADHLYRVTRSSVTRVIPVGLNTVDLLMVFGIKETQCVKTSGTDPQTCAFRRFVPSLSCSSRVRMFSSSTQVVSLRCGRDSFSSSSSESSEEIFGRHHFNIPNANRAPAPAAPPAPPSPPPQPGRSLHRQTEDVPLRGDTFTNYLV